MTAVPVRATGPYTLTATGWPRPVFNGYPVPWVAPAEHLAEVNEGRRLASSGGAICQVCGEGFEWGDLGYGFVETNVPVGEYLSYAILSAEPVFFLDGAILHHRCAKLTAARCPHVRDRAELRMVCVPANDADPKENDSGRIVPTYPAGDCEVVAWPVTR